MKTITEKHSPLRKSTDTYKLVIPIEVEKKIRHLCSEISQVEWSGTLFYTHSGSYEEGTLEIRCVDIFPMDIGSQAYTEFDMSPDVIAYMTDHPELLDCQIGLIHSHHTMASFFSGTDTATLMKEGNDRNHFVSLIVNNAGTYTAAITRKLTIKKAITSSYTYKSFGDIEKVGEKTEEVEEEVIEYNSLNIIKEGEGVSPFLEIDQRLSAIKKAKEEAKKNGPSVIYYNDFEPEAYSLRTGNQPSLFDVEYMESNPPKCEVPYNNITVPTSVVKSLTLQCITGSIAISDTSKIDPNKWVSQMVKLFDNRFNNDMATFRLWAEMFTEFILSAFVPAEYSYQEDEYISILSEEIYTALDRLPQNKYIEILKDTLVTWMK